MEQRRRGELPAEVVAATGYRYCTMVWLVCNGGLVEHVFLSGTVPYTDEVIAAELTARNYRILRVHRPHGRLRVDVDGLQFHEPYRVIISTRDPMTWYGVFINDVFYNWSRRCWYKAYRRESDDDDDRFLSISREQAERLIRTFGIELPPHATLTAIAAHAHTRLRRHWARDQQWYARRRAQFAGQAADVRALAARLAETPPLRQSQHGAPFSAVAARVEPVAARLDQPFPLVRTMIGDLGHRQVVINRLRLDTPAAMVTLTVTAWPGPVDLEYLAVTPYCPAEGYRLDRADTEPQARAAKLADGFWGHLTPEAFPVSPYRLRVLVEHDAAPGSAAAELVEHLWLELSFSPDTVLLGIPLPSPHPGDTENLLFYDQFVPADLPELVEVEGITPAWVSIHVPTEPDLLKTVTATFRHLHHRNPPSPGYID